MRIAFFSDFSLAQVTGISDVIRTLMQGLKERGHAVCLFAPSEPAGTPDLETLEHVALPSIGVPGAPTFRFPLPFGVPQALRDFRPDVLHTHTFGSIGFRAVWSAKRLHAPLVGTEHTLPAEYAHYFHLDYVWARNALKRFAARYYQKCDAVTAPSHAVAEELRSDGVTKPIRVIENPLETGIFRPLPDSAGLKKQWGITKTAVLSFGRLAKEKNIGELLEAFALLRKNGTDAELVIIGSGPAERDLRAQVATLKIGDATRFLGTRRGEELSQAVNATDVFAITSRSENQSMTTLQAMACGLPVIGVNCGGLPEYIRDGENGFIVESGDTHALATRLAGLLSDAAQRKTLGERGRQMAAEHAPERIVERMEELYSSIVKNDVPKSGFARLEGHK
ncbi:MAG: glycosyltransferase [Candidatus Peribacteraceae bacterium]|nr:glycosyltransferase [Candidatus Peribacteraceae bacterium]MDD5740054.1 glycosyltransferase [Candidatus Peribacteraceae bacterium]